jgi:alkylation response protein AidB-like acyl-CoA dehydrogenase
VTLNRFQALTFRAADMYVSLELARSTALWASMVATPAGDVVAAADRARLQTSRAGRHIGKEAIQLHGGIGVTAEYTSVTTPAGSPPSTTSSATATGRWPGSPAASPTTRRSTRSAPRTPDPPSRTRSRTVPIACW